MSRGRLVDAMRASYALPGIFQPVRVNGRWLVDGALVNPVPVSAARALGASWSSPSISRPTSSAAAPLSTTTPPNQSPSRRSAPPQPMSTKAAMRAGSFVASYRRARRPAGHLVGDGRGLQHHPGSHCAFAAGRRSPRLNWTEARQIGNFDFHRADELIRRGEEATKRHLVEMRSARSTRVSMRRVRTPASPSSPKRRLWSTDCPGRRR